jgi:endonuclease/exonuclease/phosphatase family metal-dependent hydrolase
MHVCRSAIVVEIVKRRVRIGTYNLQSCAEGEEGRLQLSMLAGELQSVGIGLCGLQELRWKLTGECDIVPSKVTGIKGEGAWKLVWSGANQRREQGVGLLMAPTWRDALLSFSQLGPRLLSARF